MSDFQIGGATDTPKLPGLLARVHLHPTNQEKLLLDLNELGTLDNPI